MWGAGKGRAAKTPALRVVIVNEHVLILIDYEYYCTWYCTCFRCTGSKDDENTLYEQYLCHTEEWEPHNNITCMRVLYAGTLYAGTNLRQPEASTERTSKQRRKLQRSKMYCVEKHKK